MLLDSRNSKFSYLSENHVFVLATLDFANPDHETVNVNGASLLLLS